jgi:hypothetical protein
MISGMHAIIFSKHAESVQRFLGEILKLRSVDAGDGWPIFPAPPTELAVHSTDGEPEHELYLMCDGADRRPRLGSGAALRLPDGDEIGLYEPKHPSPLRREPGSMHVSE